MTSPTRSSADASRPHATSTATSDPGSPHQQKPSTAGEHDAYTNTAAFAHNGTLPVAHQQQAQQPEQYRQIPDFHFRKPSAAGLQLQTGLTSDTPKHESSAVLKESTPRRPPTPNQYDLSRLASRMSWGSGGGSPTSNTSSPALGALNDVTPLPSPLMPNIDTESWTRRTGRPHSSSTTSIERERAAGLLSPAVSTTSPRKKKAYGALVDSAPTSAYQQETNGIPDRFRAQSEYVPEHLQNARPRTVTGPISSIPVPSHLDTTQQDTPLHRELHLAKHKPSVDHGASPLDPSQTLPSPPPSTHTLSEEDYDVGTTPSTFLNVRDAITNQTTTWKTLRQLGTGSFSEVVLATRNIDASSRTSAAALDTPDDRSLVAIKIVSHETNQDEERMDTSIKREIEILQSMSHPCLPQLFAFEDTPTRALLVLNYCPGGDLFEVASQQRDQLTNNTIQRIFAELVGATLCLHQNLICHRDIKLENILLNLTLASLPQDPRTHPTAIITLIDLGLAKHIPPPPASPLLTHPCGSVDYAAPEVLLGQPYDGRATDAWALGVLLYALMEGRLPFDPPPNARRRGTSNVKHRIARCDWLWCEYGDADGDWRGDTPKGMEMHGAREVVEGLLKKVGRGRWSLDRVASSEWVREGIKLREPLKAGL